MTEVPSPRAAGLLFARALQQVSRIEPSSIRGPITNMLEAGVELCAISDNLIGKPINPLLALARGLTSDARIDIIVPGGEHRYWSTHCRHEDHDACKSEELAPGVPRRPAQCKGCEAPCICGCHKEGT